MYIFPSSHYNAITGYRVTLRSRTAEQGILILWKLCNLNFFGFVMKQDNNYMQNNY